MNTELKINDRVSVRYGRLRLKGAIVRVNRGSAMVRIDDDARLLAGRELSFSAEFISPA